VVDFLDAPGARSLIACPREVGSECPHCAGEIVLGEPIMVCQACGTVHHRACWKEHVRCGSYSCAPARRPSLGWETSAAVLTITQLDLERAVPLPTSAPRVRYVHAAGFAVGAASATAPAGVSKLAIASLVCGLAGIPFFDLITGLVAVGLGVLALSAIRVSSQRGLGIAIAGLILGIVDVTGWIILLGVLLTHRGPDLRFAELAPDMAVIKELEPALQRATRANVLIERGVGPMALGGKAIGSGVILQIMDDEALIVTNRHVVDDDFPSSENATNQADGISRLGGMKVKMLGPANGEGKVVWLAPSQIDLALVRSSVPASSQAQAAAWRKGRPMKVGASVFAIGNPHNLGWLHTQGVISQLRTQDIGSRQIRVIQTQAAINPGNSGGGLYDQEGYLLGINSWTADKSVSEGLGFAITLEALLELAPPQLVRKDENAWTAPHAICIGDHWSPGEPLWSIIARIGEMISYQSYNTKSPLNGEAARWVDEHVDELPLDPVSMMPDDAELPQPIARPQIQPLAALPPRRAPQAAPAQSQVTSAPQSVTAPLPSPAAQEDRYFACPQCGATLRVTPQLSGKQVRCLRCRTVFRVPSQ
jgi:hypothetical protein